MAAAAATSVLRRQTTRSLLRCDATGSRIATIKAAAAATQRFIGTSSNARLATASPAPPAFPCVDANEARTARLLAQGPSLAASAEQETSSNDGGPEPAYAAPQGYLTYSHEQPLALDYGGELPRFDIAYETWGTLNAERTNAILLHTGLSASSHAASTPANAEKGWWEAFIGPGKPLDTNRFFVICTNVLGGCYGSTGPSSPHPLDPTGSPYATRFPILTLFDMLRAQFTLLDSMRIDKLYASVGSSMGGMQSVAAAHMHPERVQRVVSISGCARSAPASIALRYAQRSDPNWNRGFYYDKGSLPPHTGMKLARQIATITYRSGPEWEQRFGRHRRRLAAAAPSTAAPGARVLLEGPEAEPALCPDFLIETYLDHQGESFCLKYDANSLIYISKAMDLFDMSDWALADLEKRRAASAARRAQADGEDAEAVAAAKAIVDAGAVAEEEQVPPRPRRQHIHTLSSPSAHAYLPALTRGLSRLSNTPTLILGAQTDILFPVEQQRELAECLRMNGNDRVRYYEIDAPHGHDSFLIDVANVGGALKGFLD